MNVTFPNLPLCTQPLVDRQEDLEETSALLLGDEARLLTLTGPAGVGKTRLALAIGRAVAGHFADGVVFVDLAPVSDPYMVLSAIAGSLGSGTGPETEGALEWLKTTLRDRTMLLILDNFEQVLSAALHLAELHEAAPRVAFLVTSREPLQLRSEQLYHVQPMELPDPQTLPPLEDLAQVHSVALFLQRARAIDRSFALTEENARAVAELMVHLDGLPLAIQLAAARTNVLSPTMILERLGRRLSILQWRAHGLPERHQTLRSALAWSYDLLCCRDKALFRRLGVFPGGFTLEEAEVVAAPLDLDPLDGLASLVDKSLVQVQRPDPDTTRYVLLESIREYALERLEEAGEGEEAERGLAMALLLVPKARMQVPEKRHDLDQVVESAPPTPFHEVERREEEHSLLSPRERETLQLVAQGLSNKQIAKQLVVAESTAKSFVTGMFNKLGVDRRAQAVAVAAQRGLL
jgi:predicted ATPase/DNA-binding CsgD family transcriptional regulator